MQQYLNLSDTEIGYFRQLLHEKLVRRSQGDNSQQSNNLQIDLSDISVFIAANGSRSLNVPGIPSRATSTFSANRRTTAQSEIGLGFPTTVHSLTSDFKTPCNVSSMPQLLRIKGSKRYQKPVGRYSRTAPTVSAGDDTRELFAKSLPIPRPEFGPTPSASHSLGTALPLSHKSSPPIIAWENISPSTAASSNEGLPHITLSRHSGTPLPYRLQTRTALSLHPPKSGKCARARTVTERIDDISGSLPDINVGSKELQKQLFQSLSKMQNHTDKVKENILQLQHMKSLNQNPRARQLLFVFASERMHRALQRVVVHELRRGWTAWTTVVLQEHVLLKYHSLVRFHQYRYLLKILTRHYAIYLQNIILKWVEFTAAENKRLFKLKCNNAAALIQRNVRGMLARINFAIFKEQKKYSKLYTATIRIQAIIRGRVQRKRYLREVKLIQESRASVHIQRLERGRRARKRVKIERRKRNKNLSAILLQSFVRKIKAKRRVSFLREERRRMRSAVLIQSHIRRFLAVSYVLFLRRSRLEKAAATMIQSLLRGAVTRMHMDRIRREIAEYRAQRHAYATRIQSIYRGHHGRILTRLKLQEYRRKMKRFNDAALSIQCMIRCRQARSAVKRKREAQYQGWVEDARKWHELWSEEANNWFYLEIASNASQWEPSGRGYTKADGRLVLANGAIIDDPLNANQTQSDATKLCSECSDRIATRHCNECGDIFCTKCYKAAHTTGTRKKHTWTPKGPLDCMECELKLADKWCVTCDEAFCEGCWRKVHTKGKRRFHPFSAVDPDGKIDHKIFTIDGKEVAHYDVAYTQKRAEIEADLNTSGVHVPISYNYENGGYPQGDHSYDQSYTSAGSTAKYDWSGYDQGSAEANASSAHTNSHADNYNPTSGFYGQEVFDYANPYPTSGPHNNATGDSEQDQGFYDGHSQHQIVYHDPNVTDGSEWAQANDANEYPYWYNSITGHSQYENPFQAT